MQTNRKLSPSERYAQYERGRLERELAAAEATERELRRQLRKTEEQLTQTRQAYEKTVANMLTIVSENLRLTHECERLRGVTEDHFYVDLSHDFPSLNSDEVSAIRKAMARLHHPDVGGNAQRMQFWNSLLDRFEAS